MTRHDLLEIALAYDNAPSDVRARVAATLRTIDDYGAGCAAMLMRPEPRRYVWPGNRAQA